MLIALALLGQTISLEADPVAAGMTCARAHFTMLGAGPAASDERLAWSSRMGVYMLNAAAPATRQDQFLTRVSVRSTEAWRPLPEATARQLIPLCEARFPLAAAPMTLPANALDRDMMCAAVISLFSGMVRRWEDPALAWVEAEQPRAIARLQDGRLARPGVSTASIQAAMSRQLAKSVALGDLLSVSKACVAMHPTDSET